MSRLTLPDFVAKWKACTLTESAASQSHFNDLCDVLGQPHPTDVDHVGDTYTFERGVHKIGGGEGWADVWMRGHFGWEYKGKHKDLNAAYKQLLQYREDLENPPLLIVCDLDRFEIHTNFTATAKKVYAFDLDDLLGNVPTAPCDLPPLEVLRWVFTDPARLKPAATPAQVTESAAREFSKIASSLRDRGAEPERAAHFLMRLLFCLFAEDIGLLPEKLFSRLVTGHRSRPPEFTRKLRQLFKAMAGEGGSFGEHDIEYFDGGLFMDDEALDLTSADLEVLGSAAGLDWSSIEPAIFGTLFERSLDPSKRSQLGAHYTSREDIELIVEPVLMAPLRREWLAIQGQATSLAAKIATAKAAQRAKLKRQLSDLLMGFADRLSQVRVLDPACGSGNFLYVALKRLLDLEKEVSTFAANNGLSGLLPRTDPIRLFGIETNVYAHELASVVVWIGYIQWQHENGFNFGTHPVLRPLQNIRRMDAVLAYNDEREPVEPKWPEADVIIGNPPFLGGKKLRTELGDEYVDDLFKLYDGRVPREADLVTYWFEKARAMIKKGRVNRAGLLATQGIRGGANRKALERIKSTGDIFFAISDRDWILDGAAVHVAMIGFDGGTEQIRDLDFQSVSTINADLTTETNIASAKRLNENADLAFMGMTRIGRFELTAKEAAELLALPRNPNGRPNSDVIRPWINASDITRQSRGMYIIDFGAELDETSAALYEQPFEILRQRVYAERQKNNRQTYRRFWWRYGEPRPALRRAIAPLHRYIATPMVSKHRVFVWVPVEVVPENLINVIARDDDYFLGVLHSRIHELWARRTGTQLREAESGFRYTPTSTFETFPFPWPPGHEPAADPRVERIATAARELVRHRDAWLNPEGASEAELKRRTLTNLYNEMPQWLANLHRALDAAVFNAYGWPHNLSDAEILERLLALNHQRSTSPGNSATEATKAREAGGRS